MNLVKGFPQSVVMMTKPVPPVVKKSHNEVTDQAIQPRRKGIEKKSQGGVTGGEVEPSAQCHA